jgi:hypothetical protein
LQGITGEKIAHPGREVPPAVVELVELLPFCGLSVFLLLTGDQIQALIETTADGKHFSFWLSDPINFLALVCN